MEPLSQTERDWGMQLAAERGPQCLEAEKLVALAEKGRRAPDAATLYAHIAACPGCRAALRELKQVEALRTSVAKAPAVKSLGYFPRSLLWPVAAAAAILLLYFTYRTTLPSAQRSASPETMASKGRSPKPEPRSNAEIPPPEFITPAPAPKTVEPTPVPEKPAAKARPRKRSRPAPVRIAVPDPVLERPVETMDANIGWSRGELAGEVVGENVATGEVVPPNMVQGEVKGSEPEPPTDLPFND